QIIKTDKAPAPIGPYNQAIKAGETIYLSGQIAINPQTGNLVTDDIVAETHQVMQNIKAILEASKISFEHVVKT
ncbi:Rid family hydrolase, partial [Streptomyces sp. UMAF16]|nr:Rid family hydrolase [Streptomyces sp. UMAF16]